MRKGASRLSNIEALRIISLILVMVVHASFKSLDMPSLSEIEYQPINSFFRFFSESISIVCVNSFILISGWFGINVKIKRFMEFIFQYIFIVIIFHLILSLIGQVNYGSFKEWISLLFHNNYWFVSSYITLYILSPLLNVYSKIADEKEFRLFLIAFFTLQTLYGFILFNHWFAKGYSPMSFIGLYLLARYMRTYSPTFCKLASYKDLLIFIGLAIVNSLIAISFIIIGHGDPWRLYAYSSPLVIIQSAFLLLFFSKLTIKSSVINWLAISSFSAYLVHCHPDFFDSIYIKHIRDCYCSNTIVYFFIDTSAWIILIFASSLIFDKIRIMIWKTILFIFQIR